MKFFFFLTGVTLTGDVVTHETFFNKFHFCQAQETAFGEPLEEEKLLNSRVEQQIS